MEMTGIRGTAAAAAAVASVLLLFCRPAVPASSRDITSRQSDTLAFSLNALRAASEDMPSTMDVLPPSPKAAAFMKYGDYPVSLYTGLVDITIPLYTIRTGWTEIPVELKYHASGLRYDDISMEAGLGWDLIAGGVLTQAVRGADDNKVSNHFVKDAEEIDKTDYASDHGDYHMLRYVDKGNRGTVDPYTDEFDNSVPMYDGEADMYSYSFLGHYGKLCFPIEDSQVSGDVNADVHGLFIPLNGMRSSRPTPQTITDTEGIRYVFGVRYEDLENLNTKMQFHEYYLSEIISADNADTVRFSYTEYGLGGASMSQPLLMNGLYTVNEPTGTYDDIITYGGMYRRAVRPPRLDRIEFNSGHVEFTYSSGIDAWNLLDIKIYTGQQLIQTVTLEKGSFSNGQKRLDGISYTSCDNESFSYSFDYYTEVEPGNYYVSTQYADVMDYWGYRTSDVSEGNFIPWFSSMSQSLKPYTVDRNPDSTYMKGGILTKITYPTGGYTEFEYEPHYSSHIPGSTDIEMCGGLRIKEIRNYLQDGSLAERKWYRYGMNECGGGRTKAYPVPTVGDFTTDKLEMTVRQELDTDGRPVGSPRLASTAEMTHYSCMPKNTYFMNGSPVVYPYVTEYRGDGTSIEKTEYVYSDIKDMSLSPQSKSGTYRWRSADMPAYDNTWKSGKLISKTVYRKEGDIYEPVSKTENTYALIDTVSYMNLRVLQYANFRYTPHNYEFPDVYDISKMYWYDSSKPYRDEIDKRDTYPENGTPFNYFNYYITSGFNVLASTTETTDGVSSTTRYEYNRYGFPTRTVTTHSTGDSTVTVTRYVTDEGTLYSGMTTRNMVSPVTSVDVTRNGVPVSSRSMSYSNTLSGNTYLYALSESESSLSSDIGADAWNVTYHRYDSYGHPLHVTLADGLDVVYIWSYGSRYPVLEIRNATYTQVGSALGSSLMSSIPGMENPTGAQLEGYAATLRESLDDAMVTLYTYRPLVGVASITDPSGRKTTYEYDGFGRLVKVVDEDGNPVESYEYHYTR